MTILLPLSQNQPSTLVPRTVPPSTKNGLIINSIHHLPIESFKKKSKTQTDNGLFDGTTKTTPITVIPKTPSSKGRMLEPKSATIGVNYLTASSSERLKMLKLDQHGLTSNDIDIFHNYWFGLPHMTDHISSKRYFSYFNSDPQSVLHCSYIIWAHSAKDIPQYESKSIQLYEKAIELGDMYWKNKQSMENFNMHYYLHYLNDRYFYEYLTGNGLNCSLTLSSCMRLAQLAGYIQIYHLLKKNVAFFGISTWVKNGTL
ncbi:unnamed protein product [Ambrosiozyma monospora]|uniref:Unnamed protein product n=1 Tax=Ambrosiozyma monospora TaxID=43982 RepID=A0ACB5TUP0_AMBMO|nr:unnamed protein product [Ambrosiozyma monospora]